MKSDEDYMRRCLELAERGRRTVSPNPMVGCVIVSGNQVIGEGWHRQYGEAHAEANAIASVQDKSLLPGSTLYVNLEPCSHYGKTPPCANLIIDNRIPEVVIGCMDASPRVAGKGIKKLRDAGVKVLSGVLENECLDLNKRFFHFHKNKRPYIILKWAETADGFLDHQREAGTKEKPLQISGAESLALLHRWRSEEQAILVGTQTALLDNPRLSSRTENAHQPIRILIDQYNQVPATAHLKDSSIPTLVFCTTSPGNKFNLEYIPVSFQDPIASLHQIMEELYKRNIISLLVEGGARLLNSFFEAGLWEECRIFIAPQKAVSGVSAPRKPSTSYSSQVAGEDELRIYGRTV